MGAVSVITVKHTTEAVQTVRDMLVGAEDRQTAKLLASFFARIAGGLVDGAVEVMVTETEEVAEPKKSEPKAAAASKKVTKSKDE